ncbi:MAG: 4Fe-4S binding protein [Roseovarius sp.]
MADLSVTFSGLRLKNPIIVASAEPSNSVKNIRKCIDHGAAAVITKTIGDAPNMSRLTENSKYAILNDKGTLIRGKVPRSFVFYSRSGYVTEPAQDWSAYLTETQAYAARHGAHIIGNIASNSVRGWCELARLIERCGVPMIEANFQHPHPTDLDTSGAEGIWIAQDPEITAEVTRRIVEAVDIPVMVKLTPESNRITEIARAALGAGAASVAVSSRFVGFAVDIETGEPWIGGPAGVGGPWVKYITQRWIHDIYSKLGAEISGSNGIFDARDAVEFIMSGARVMQVGSVLMLKGVEWLDDVIKGMERFLDTHGYDSVDAIHGIASRRAFRSPAEALEMERLFVEIDHEKCRHPTCSICVKMCFYDSLSIGDGRIVTAPDSCIGCELCYNVCPFDAMRMVPQSARHAQSAAE